MYLVKQNEMFYTTKSHNYTNKLTNCSSSRQATSKYCKVKLLVLSMEFGGFDESIDCFTFSSVLHLIGLSDGKEKP